MSKLGELRDEIPYTKQFYIWRTLGWLQGLSREKRMTLLVKTLGYLVTLKFLDGYRTQAGGVAAILGGVAYIALAINGDPNGSVEKGIAAIIAGATAIGAAGKMDKQVAATQGTTQVIAATDPTASRATTKDAAAVIANLPTPVKP